MAKKEITIDAWPEKEKNGKPLRYWVLNEQLHKAADSGYKHIIVKNTLGQRFMCAGMEHKDVKVDIYGTPGNDLGVFMDGPTIEVHGSAEDQAGNTMNSGTIAIHGNAWDVTGLAARGGKLFVRGDGGYRIGIHMKEFNSMKPVVVYGGCAKEFFGEYMSGGILIALGLKFNNGSIQDAPIRSVVASSLGSGIHGGVIYVRGEVPEEYLGVGAKVIPMTEEDGKMLKPILTEFCQYFNVPVKRLWDREIVKVAPASSRPFAAYYNYRSV
jgi:glutamate synthase domain-containing protein 3